MGKIIWHMGISLDGFIEGVGGDLSWHRVDEELHLFMNALVRTRAALLSGGRMFRLMDAYWPTADQDPNAGPSEREFAPIWRAMPKFVVSRTLAHGDATTTIMRDFDIAEIDKLKAQIDGDISLGGADIANMVLKAGRVDELDLFVHPVLVGAGKPMFVEARADWRLIAQQTFGNGVVRMRYAVER